MGKLEAWKINLPREHFSEIKIYERKLKSRRKYILINHRHVFLLVLDTKMAVPQKKDLWMLSQQKQTHKMLNMSVAKFRI